MLIHDLWPLGHRARCSPTVFPTSRCWVRELGRCQYSKLKRSKSESCFLISSAVLFTFTLKQEFVKVMRNKQDVQGLVSGQTNQGLLLWSWLLNTSWPLCQLNHSSLSLKDLFLNLVMCGYTNIKQQRKGAFEPDPPLDLVSSLIPSETFNTYPWWKGHQKLLLNSFLAVKLKWAEARSFSKDISCEYFSTV